MARKPEKSSDEMTFFEHLDALRPHLVRSAFALVTCFVAAFVAKHYLIDSVLMAPCDPGFPLNRLLAWLAALTGNTGAILPGLDFSMINTTMAGQFNLHVRISLIAALVVAAPYLAWELWQFIKPALTPKELKGSRMFVFFVSLCFFTGVLFGYFVIAPLTVNFLAGYTASARIVNMIDAGSYLSTVANLALCCGLVFELPLLVWFLARMGILTPAFMKKYRRHAIVALAILSAVITPPDIMSLFLVWLPLYGLYEASIGIAARVERQRNADRVP